MKKRKIYVSVGCIVIIVSCLACLFKYGQRRTGLFARTQNKQKSEQTTDIKNNDLNNRVYVTSRSEVQEELPIYESLEDVINLSENIFYGKVLSDSFAVRDGYIYTDVTVEVLESYKGALHVGDRVSFHKGGGCVTLQEYFDSMSEDEKISSMELLECSRMTEEELKTHYIESKEAGWRETTEGGKSVFFVKSRDLGDGTPIFNILTGGYRGEYHENSEGVLQNPSLDVNEASVSEDIPNDTSLVSKDELVEQISAVLKEE